MFFRLSSLELWLLIFGIVLGTTLLGVVAGRRLRAHAETLREPFGVLQAALLGLVALILAFGLTPSGATTRDVQPSWKPPTRSAPPTCELRRFESRRAHARSNCSSAIRTRLSACLNPCRGSAAARDAIADGDRLQRALWRLAGEALADSPNGSAPRLYGETLNEMIDMQTVQVSALNNRVPNAVLTIEVIGASVALGLLALYVAILARGVISVVLAAAFVSVLLLITFDLDRPVRGLVTVPNTPLVSLRASMELPPAAQAPGGP